MECKKGGLSFLWLLILLFIFSDCKRNDSIVVASKNFSEQVILGELLAQQIERSIKVPVIRKLNLGGTFVCHQAIVAGKADAYAEYTGTALTAILKQDPLNDPGRVYQQVAKSYRDQFDLEWTEPFGFNNTFAIIIRGEEARKHKIHTISQAAAFSPQWRPGFGYEFMERKDGFSGLSQTYGLRFAEAPRTMDLTLTYKAVADKQVDLIAGNSTDGLIAKLDLVVLQDDKHYFPPYEAAPVIRRATLQKYPELRGALKQLGGKINEETMRNMNYRVDVEHRDVKKVVSDFLDGKK